jgi:hypothetical protein
VVGLHDPGREPVEHAHRWAGAFAYVGGDVGLQYVEVAAVVGPEQVSAAWRLQPHGSAEERVVGTAEANADQRAAALSGLSGNPIAGGPALAAHQATRPELQLAVVAQIGQARARHNHGLSTAGWAHDMDEAGVRGQRPTTIEEPTPGDVVGHHGLILT